MDGAANAELVDLLARWLGVPRRQVTLEHGDASRKKRVRVGGLDVAAAEAAMTAL